MESVQRVRHLSAPWVISFASLICGCVAVIGFIQARTKIHSLESEIKRIARPIDDSQPPLAVGGNVLGTPKTANGAKPEGPAASAKIVPRQPKTIGTDWSKMLRNPAWAPLWRRHEIRICKLNNYIIVASMNLPPDKVARLWELLAERAESSSDAVDAAQKAGIPEHDWPLAWHEAEDEIDAQITNLIGSDNYALMQSPAASEVPTVNVDLGREFEADGLPLTPHQIAALAQAYAGVHLPEYLGSHGAPIQTPDPATGLTPILQTVIDQAKSSLSASQISILTDYFREQVQLQQYRSQEAKEAP